MYKPSTEFLIDSLCVGGSNPTYFIADIAANHDGDLERAKHLIYLAKDAGADAAKFQHFKAETIVSDFGFRSLGSQHSHQKSWKKSVFDIYKDASVSLDWTQALKETCDKVGITFFTSPYDLDLIENIDKFVPAYKIGSGDITWIELIQKIASKNKPYIIATGASTINDVQRAVHAALEINPKLALLQCNTNYTGSVENMRYVQLNVLKLYRLMYPDMVLGLSDHTPGHSSVLGAVALGAKIIEKHFTDDVSRDGPDHAFSMSPTHWREMVDRTRELEAALGGSMKKVEENEFQTIILQRRAIRLSRNLPAGHRLALEDIVFLRPCPGDALPPYLIHEVIGRTIKKCMQAGEHINLDLLL